VGTECEFEWLSLQVNYVPWRLNRSGRTLKVVICEKLFAVRVFLSIKVVEYGFCHSLKSIFAAELTLDSAWRYVSELRFNFWHLVARAD